MNEEYSYVFYTFFKNLQKMKEKPPWCLFEIYHTYGFDTTQEMIIIFYPLTSSELAKSMITSSDISNIL